MTDTWPGVRAGPGLGLGGPGERGGGGGAGRVWAISFLPALVWAITFFPALGNAAATQSVGASGAGGCREALTAGARREPRGSPGSRRER